MKRMRTKNYQPEFPLRKLLENDVAVMNKYLKPVVRLMPLDILLANCHPLYRGQYASELYREGYISEEVYKDNTNFTNRLSYVS